MLSCTSILHFMVSWQLRSRSQRGASTPAGSTPRKSTDRLVGWGANLGGQISTFVGSLTKERAASPGKAAPSAGSGSRLRGLFLREGGPANTAAAGVLPPAPSAGEVLQNGNPSASEAADVQDAGTSTLQAQNSCVPYVDTRCGCPRKHTTSCMQPAATLKLPCR